MSELDTLTFHLLNVLGLSHDSAEIVMDRIRELQAERHSAETRLNDALVEIEHLNTLVGGPAHSCSESCTRPMCVLRRERDGLAKALEICTAERDGARAERNFYQRQLSGRST